MEAARQRTVLSISELATRLSTHLNEAFPPCWIQGELSGYRKHGSGHHYFTIKDARAQFSAVLWRNRAERLDFDPKDGQQVEAQVRLVFYGPGGRLQLEVQGMRRSGLGELMQRFLELKERLQDEGLFDEARKVALPPYPAHIGILTARGGAALSDMLTVLHRRWPGIRITIRPSPVQGEGAGPALARNLALLQQVPGLDLILLGRGGGSFEDLFAFNSEELARAIVACPLPLISAVGHEVDTGISDMVADLRAPTPSAAAELAVPEASEVRRKVQELRDTLERTLQDRLREAAARLNSLGNHRALFMPRQRLHDAQQRLDENLSLMRRALQRNLSREHDRLQQSGISLQKALQARYQLAAESLKGRLPRLHKASQREVVTSQLRLAQVMPRFRRALEQWLVQQQEALQGLESRLGRQEASRRRQWALRMGYAEVLDAEGKWLRSLHQLPQQGPAQLQFEGGRRKIHLEPPAEQE